MAPQGSLDLDEVRGSFPSLANDQVFFDNAGGSQTLGTVVDRIRDYLLHSNVQLGASYATGRKATTRYNEGYVAAAKYINASEDEIVLGSSTTQLYRNLASTLNFNEGDELVISSVDHESNVAPWVDLAERQKLVIRWWKPEPTADLGSKANPKLTPENLLGLLSARTRLVTLTHASNILGTIHDLKAIAETVHTHSPDALVCVDGVAYAPHRKIDVKELGVDFYAFSWYKVYGPHISLLYASPTGLAQMRSLGHYFKSHKTLQDKIGLGGSSYELVYAIPAVVEYLGSGDGPSKWEGIIRHEAELQETLLRYLTGRDDVIVWGERSADVRLRVPTISFTVRGWNSKALVESVEKETNFGFRFGTFYSVRLATELLGLVGAGDAVVRVSMVHYNTVDEVNALISALDKVLSQKT